MSHLLYLMFRCDFDVMENLDFVGGFWDLNTPRSFRRPHHDEESLLSEPFSGLAVSSIHARVSGYLYSDVSIHVTGHGDAVSVSTGRRRLVSSLSSTRPGSPAGSCRQGPASPFPAPIPWRIPTRLLRSAGPGEGVFN